MQLDGSKNNEARQGRQPCLAFQETRIPVGVQRTVPVVPVVPVEAVSVVPVVPRVATTVW